METVSKAYVKILYEGKNISEDISAYITSFSYTDNVTGKADEVEISLNDQDGLFSNAWYPDKKSLLTCEIQFGDGVLPCGQFYISEVTCSGSPDTVTWHAMSINPNSKMKTKKSKGYNKVSLLDVAKEIANAHDLTLDDGTKTITLQLPPTDKEQSDLNKLQKLFNTSASQTNETFFYSTISALTQQLGKVIISLNNKGYTDQADELKNGISTNLLDPNGDRSTKTDVQIKKTGAVKMSSLIGAVSAELKALPATQTKTLGLGLQKIKVDRLTQNNETDLFFLARIAKQYGLAFNIKPPKLIFYSAFQLADAPEVVTIDKTQVTSYSFTDKITGTYTDVNVSSHNPNTNKTITNGTTLVNTADEQSKLQYLAAYISKAALVSNYNGRLAFIRKAGETNDAVLKGLSSKGFGEEYDILIAAYALLFADKSIEACVRYANVCKDLRTRLLKIQAEGNKVTKDKDAYSGGQSANVLKVRGKVEDQDQADAMAKSALYNANSKTKTGSMALAGGLLYVAGNNFAATGFGRNTGKYTIVTSTHSVAGEYTCSLEFKVGPVTIKTSKNGKVTVK